MRTRDPQFRNRCLIYAGLALATLAVYLPAVYHGFVEYDDQQYVTDNPRVQAGLTWNGLVWAFGFHAGNWHPLAWLSHMLDCQLYGARAGGHHLTGILLHVASTLLLFSVLNRMTQAMWRSAAVAALFAWHPLHVESVAWVAERKDVLCAFFWMLTLWCYAKRVACCVLREKTAGASRITHHASLFYWLPLLCFALALMSKPMAVTLPFVLVLLDFWPLGRFTIYDLRFTIFKTLLLEKVPFFVLSAGACWLTLRAQQIAIVSTAGLTVSQRIAHTLAAYNYYFWAVLFPHNLAVYYPYVINIDAGTIVFSVVVIALVTLVALKNFRQRPWLLVGWLWFLGTLVPVIGLVQVGDQAWADRYSYLPLVGLFVAVVWGLGDLVEASASQPASPAPAESQLPSPPRRGRSQLVLGALAGLVGMAMLAGTSLQVRHWKNTRALFEHAASVTKGNSRALTVLGSLAAAEGKGDEAKRLY